MLCSIKSANSSQPFLPIVGLILILHCQRQRDWFVVWLSGFTNFYGIGPWLGFLLARFYDGCRLPPMGKGDEATIRNKDGDTSSPFSFWYMGVNELCFLVL